MLKKLSEHFTQGSLSTAIAINLSQAFPSFIGYPIARLIAKVLSIRHFSPLVKAVRLNQWIVHDREINRRELNEASDRVFLHQAYSLYTFYHNLDRPEKVKQLVKISPKMKYLMETSNRGGQGTMMLIPHLTGFDLGGLLLGQMGFKFLTLSYPNPPHGYEWQNQIRNERGLEVMPMSFQSTQLARERLQAGGTVLTGIDRPYPGTGYFPLFFGYPADLPVAYIKLAMRAKARVFVVAFQSLADHAYEIDASDEIPLLHQEDPRKEVTDNASRVLTEAEVFIRRNPVSWAMFYPVWPELRKELS
jgi:phosphatidylinositol dimannoside acyltransferase